MLGAVLLALVQLSDLPPLRLELLDGRAELATERGVVELDARHARREHAGPGYLEAGALARLSLRWSQCATLALEGPTALEWRASSGPKGGLFVEVVRIDRANLEVRRGPVRFALPGGWHAHLEHGAAFLRELSDGSLELEHAAGAPILLSLEREGGAVRPPWTVLPGARVRLGRSAAEPEPTASSRARVLSTWTRDEARVREARVERAPWSSCSWPWKGPATAAR
jgi:hypothetical protein